MPRIRGHFLFVYWYCLVSIDCCGIRIATIDDLQFIATLSGSAGDKLLASRTIPKLRKIHLRLIKNKMIQCNKLNTNRYPVGVAESRYFQLPKQWNGGKLKPLHEEKGNQYRQWCKGKERGSRETGKLTSSPKQRT